jgi:hypothetical protein
MRAPESPRQQHRPIDERSLFQASLGQLWTVSERCSGGTHPRGQGSEHLVDEAAMQATRYSPVNALYGQTVLHPVPQFYLLGMDSRIGSGVV